MKNIQTFTDHLRRSVDGIAAFATGVNATLMELLSRSTYHSTPSQKISEVHHQLGAWATESVTSLDQLFEESQAWFVLFDEVRSLQKQREKTRLIYDHYVAKLDELRTSIAKKKSRNPGYIENSKEADRLQRV